MRVAVLIRSTIAVLAAASGVVIVWPSGAGANAVDLTTCRGARLDLARETAVFRLVNAERRRRGAAALRRDALLAREARRHSVWMARTLRFQHPNGGLAFAKGAPASQNLAFVSNPRSAVAGFMRSAPHRDNMLPARWRRAGVGTLQCRGMILITVNVIG
jgi:uncharacterized protein YkwD